MYEKQSNTAGISGSYREQDTQQGVEWYSQQRGKAQLGQAIQVGVRSALKELVEEVRCSCGVAADLAISVGVGYPDAATDRPEGTDSLVGIITELTSKLRTANGKVQLSLSHLNN